MGGGREGAMREVAKSLVTQTHTACMCVEHVEPLRGVCSAFPCGLTPKQRACKGQGAAGEGGFENTDKRY